MEATSSLQDVVNGDHGVDQPAKVSDDQVCLLTSYFEVFHNSIKARGEV